MQGDGARRARRGPLALLAALLLLAASGRWAATGGGGRGAGTAPRRGLRQVDAQADVGAEEDGGTEDEPEPTTPEPQCSRAETMKVGAELDDECSARCAMASVKVRRPIERASTPRERRRALTLPRDARALKTTRSTTRRSALRLRASARFGRPRRKASTPRASSARATSGATSSAHTTATNTCTRS